MPTTTSLAFNAAAFSYRDGGLFNKKPGSPTLTGVTGVVDPGEALALIGPNGAGKTTLLKGIMGAVPLVAGELRRPRARTHIGYVPQVADLDPTFPVTVSQVVGMGLYGRRGWFGRFTRAHRDVVRQALRRVGLVDKADAHFGMLSGGQQQRVLLARAIVAEPTIMLLDEPFNGLDQPNRAALVEIIRWVKTQGVIVVVSTHDLELAELTCDKVALLAGRQVAFGPLRDVLVPSLLDETFGRTSHVG